jgi:hypothetical protein
MAFRKDIMKPLSKYCIASSININLTSNDVFSLTDQHDGAYALHLSFAMIPGVYATLTGPGSTMRPSAFCQTIHLACLPFTYRVSYPYPISFEPVSFPSKSAELRSLSRGESSDYRHRNLFCTYLIKFVSFLQVAHDSSDEYAY